MDFDGVSTKNKIYSITYQRVASTVFVVHCNFLKSQII
jgi:hypothetical protein